MLPIEWQVRFYLNLNFLALGTLTTILGIYMMKFYCDKNKDKEEQPLQGLLNVKVGVSDFSIPTVYTEQKQIIYADQLDGYKILRSKRFIKECFTYGLIPFLSIKILLEDTLHQYIEIHNISLDVNYLLSVIAFILIQISFSIIQTLCDQQLLKTDWDQKSINKSIAITVWLILYCFKFFHDHYSSIVVFKYICFALTIISIQICASFGIYLVTSIKIQKYLQDSRKFE